MIAPAEAALRRWPWAWRWLDHPRADAVEGAASLAGHVVIVGCGRVGRHIAEALGRLEIPRLVVEADPARLAKLKTLAVPALYGDASSSEILEHAGLGTAKALVVTLPDDAAALAVVARARRAAPSLRIIARASSWDGARRLKAAGADEVVRPELEGGIEIVRRALLGLELPSLDVQRYVDLVRREGLDEPERISAERARLLHDLLTAPGSAELVWVHLEDDSTMAGRSIAESQLRSRTGASIVGIARASAVAINPSPDTILETGDRLALIGRPEDVRQAELMMGVRRPVQSPGV